MGSDSPEVRGPWPVSSAIELSGGLARVVVVVLLVRPCRRLDGWLELSGCVVNGSQHMTIGGACYRCHGWARSLEAGPKFLGVWPCGYDFAVMRAPAHSLETINQPGFSYKGTWHARLPDCQTDCQLVDYDYPRLFRA